MSQEVGQAKATVTKAQPGPFVPLWGLVADVLVIAALTVTIVRNSRYWLDFFHVFGGALWISNDHSFVTCASNKKTF